VSADQEGFAVALRVPNLGPTDSYLGEVRATIQELEHAGKPVDLVRVEEPIGAWMALRRYGAGELAHVQLHSGDSMYEPFHSVREGIVSARLHTSLLALIHGNRRLLQFAIEDGTQKIQEIFDDVGLPLRVYGIEKFSCEKVLRFLEEGEPIDEKQACRALQEGRRLVSLGLDETEQWLESL
jgi:hypothetical protein